MIAKMDITHFRPLLAVKAPEDLNTLRYPLYVSPKLDGIRALVLNGKLLSRTLKPIPNLFIRMEIEKEAGMLEGMDGELIVGKPTGEGVFQRSTSGVMSRKGELIFSFHVFDEVLFRVPFAQRMPKPNLNYPYFIKVVPQHKVGGPVGVHYVEQLYLRLGYEGVMLRDPNGLYKCGRSTVNEQILLKLKRFEDDEATVIGFEEKLHNENELETDERGYAKRSSRRENLTPAHTLGALICESGHFTDVFNIGTGFDDATREHIWKNKRSFRGKLVRYKFQRVGTLAAPRCPVFLGFRDLRDI